LKKIHKIYLHFEIAKFRLYSSTLYMYMACPWHPNSPCLASYSHSHNAQSRLSIKYDTRVNSWFYFISMSQTVRLHRVPQESCICQAYVIPRQPVTSFFPLFLISWCAYKFSRARSTKLFFTLCTSKTQTILQ